MARMVTKATPPSGYKSSEFHLSIIVGAIIQPLLAYYLAQKGSNLAYVAIAGSALTTIGYAISRMGVKSAWATQVLEVVEEVEKDVTEATKTT